MGQVVSSAVSSAVLHTFNHLRPIPRVLRYTLRYNILRGGPRLGLSPYLSLFSIGLPSRARHQEKTALQVIQMHPKTMRPPPRTSHRLAEVLATTAAKPATRATRRKKTMRTMEL